MSLTKTLTFFMLEIENLFFVDSLFFVFHFFAYQVYGEYVSGSINDDERKNVIRNSCPGAGACGGMYTANTMASAIEALGMSLPYR
jgi:dihydroxyacid dehydratase/phosphogluconate dehydratase